MSLLAIASLFGYALLIHGVAKKEIELCLLSALTLIIALLYCSSLAGVLPAVSTLCYVLGLVLLVSIVWIDATRGKAFAAGVLTPGIVVFMLGAIIFWWCFSAATCFFWDEFSHWGLVTKELYFSGVLDNGSGNAAFPHYPPGTALWHYFVISNTRFSEGAVYLAQFVLLTAPLTVLYRRVTWRNAWWIIVLFPLQFLLLANFGHGVASLYADPVIALLFAATVVSYLAGTRSAVDLLLLAPCLFVLALVKEVGLLFAAGAALFVLLHQALVVGNIRARILQPRRRRMIAVMFAIAFFAAPLLAQLTWSHRLDRLGIARGPGNARMEWSMVRKALSDGDHKKNIEIKKRYRNLFTSQPVSRTELSHNFNEFSYSLRGDCTRTGSG